MKPIISPEECRLADKHTVEKQGITSFQLMERAASRFTKVFLERFPDPGPGLVICGPGNNGGDGLVFSRLLLEAGMMVTVFIPDWIEKKSADFLKAQKALPSKLNVIEGNPGQISNLFQNKNWVCDALFGTGLNGNIMGPFAEMILAMNQFNGLKISIDIPSGLKPELNPDEPVFQADWTGTFETPKLPFLLPDTGLFTKKFEIIPIELELEEWDRKNQQFFFIEKEDIRDFLPKREKFSHKGNFGHGLLMAGSKGKMGAAVLGAKAMLRSGIGLVSVAIPRGGAMAIHQSVPEAMVLADDHEHLLGQFPDISPFSAIGIGPGIGQEEETAWVLKELIFTSKTPLVIDADGLNLLAKHPDWIRHLPQNSILTPHPGEWKRLAGESPNQMKQLRNALNFAIEHKVILVIKGAHTQIVCPDGKVYFNSTGNPGMATAGMGDVLTGLITGLLAQGMEPKKAAISGVYIHGKAGDLAAKKWGERSLSAGDLIEEIGQAFQWVG